MPATSFGVMLSIERGRRGFASPTVAYWRQAMGVDDTGSADERLEAASPAMHVDQIRAPVLLIHGYDDTVVPIAQSQLMQTALEGAGKGITVNAIAPGYINTDMVRAVPKPVLEKIVARIPVGRLGEAAEIARGVLFLVADDAGFITGSTLSINGGQHMY